MSKLNISVIICITLLLFCNANANFSKSELSELKEKTLNDSDSYSQSIHMYITIEALKLLKDRFPLINFSVLDNFIGTMTDFGDRPWQIGKMATGAYREDTEDPVYDIRGPFGFFASNSHFWHADNRTNGDHSLTNLNILGINYDYPNAFTKVKNYISGQWFRWNGNGYGDRKFIEYNAGNGFFYRFSYHTRGLIEFYKTRRIWLESKINTLGQEEIIRQEIEVSELIRNRIVWEVLGRVFHLNQDMSIAAHAHNDVHVVEWDGGDCYHNYIDNGGYNNFNWQTAKNAGGFIQPYGVDNDPIRYILYSTNQLADHYPSGPECFQFPQQHNGDNNLPGGTYPIINDYYQTLGPTPPFITDVNAEAVYCFNHAIRSTSSLLYWFAVEAGLINTDPYVYPVINSFSKNLPDQNIFHGETLELTCNATGSNLNYNWSIKVCDSNTFCTLPVSGLSVAPQGNKFYISNTNFLNYWTCDYYESLCYSSHGNSAELPPLDFYVKVIVSNQFGSVTKIFNVNNWKNFKPSQYLRPPPPPGGGCPFVLSNDGTQYIYDNNILERSEHYKNLNAETEDKYILRNKPYVDSLDGTIRLAIKEINTGNNFFDFVKLEEFYYPENSIPGITENNDLVLYYTEDAVNTTAATISGKDITDVMQYDTISDKKVFGKENEELSMEFSDYSNPKKKIKSTFDSIALILDPNSFDAIPIPNPIKDVSGTLFAKDEHGNIIKENFDYAIRQLKSEVIIPVTKNTKISNINLSWKRGFELSYGYLTKIHYGAMTGYQLPLVYAEKFNDGSVLDLLQKADHKYAETDSSSYIELKFQSDKKDPPSGWKRVYVLSVSGITTKNTVQNNSSSEKNALNTETSLSKNILYSNYPNPFNPTTNLEFGISQLGFVSLKVFDVTGKEVAVLVNETKTAGSYSVLFNASNLSSGIYFYKLEVNGNIIGMKKMVLLK